MSHSLHVAAKYLGIAGNAGSIAGALRLAAGLAKRSIFKHQRTSELPLLIYANRYDIQGSF